MSKKPILVALFSVALVVAVASFSSANAATSDTTVGCSATKDLYAKSFTGDVSLVSTAFGFNTTLPDFFFRQIANRSIDDYQSCGAWLHKNYSYNGAGTQCGDATDASGMCADLMNKYDYRSNFITANDQFAQGQTSGSLLGLAYTVNNYNMYEPVPTNLALFWNDSISKVPFFNKALAATVDYTQPFISNIYDAWKLSRNIAFGLMAIVLLYIGFLIILRKKIDQQTVVSVQYAIPKIVLAVILIAFSYPIGALLASVGWSLNRSAPEMVNSIYPAYSSTMPILGTTTAVGTFVLGLILSIPATGGVAVPLLGILLIICAIPVIMWLLIQIRFLLLYLKMLVSIITAPIEFVLGSVPGSSTNIVGWFTKMLSCVISLLALGITTELVLRVGMDIVFQGGGGIMAPLAAVIFVIYGYGLALSMPGRIDKLLMGDPKRR
jgi:hypothetical protein